MGVRGVPVLTAAVPDLGDRALAPPVTRAGAAVAEVLDGLGTVDPAWLGGLGLEAQIRRWERLESRVRAVKLALVAEGTARGRDTDTGASSPTAWLARLTRCDPRTARAALAQADTLATAAVRDLGT